MKSWMVQVPKTIVSRDLQESSERALNSGDIDVIPAGVPRWIFLEWLARQGWLLHGSNHRGLEVLVPSVPVDRSPDDFSKQTGVFASSDAAWAVMYAVVDRPRSVKRMLNTAVQIQGASGWNEINHFLSLAPRDPTVSNPDELLRPGAVYVTSREGFSQMQPYFWPGLGTVQEPHWVAKKQVEVRLAVPVFPEDLPIPVRIHNADEVEAASARDPWGFPWFD